MTGLSAFNEQVVGQFAQEFERLFYAANSAEMAAYYTDDARLMADGIAPIQGRAGIAQFWEMTCRRGAELKMKRSIVVDAIRAAETLSYAISTLTIVLVTPDGRPITNTVKDITIWRLEADGVWRIEVDISNQNPPLT